MRKLKTGHPSIPESCLKNLEEKKVDKEEGKGLSSNDFTDTLKTKLEAWSQTPTLPRTSLLRR